MTSATNTRTNSLAGASVSEFSPSGRLLFNAELPAGVSTYRACRLPWHPAS